MSNTLDRFAGSAVITIIIIIYPLAEGQGDKMGSGPESCATFGPCDRNRPLTLKLYSSRPWRPLWIPIGHWRVLIGPSEFLSAQDSFHPNLDKNLNIRVNRITRDRKEEDSQKPCCSTPCVVAADNVVNRIPWTKGQEDSTRGPLPNSPK